MARIAVLVPDLLFGSKVLAMLQAAGHEPVLNADPAGFDAMVVDVMADGVDLSALGASGVPSVGFYSHVEPAARDAALAAGLDVVVPRSRFNREGAELVAGLLP